MHCLYFFTNVTILSSSCNVIWNVKYKRMGHLLLSSLFSCLSLQKKKDISLCDIYKYLLGVRSILLKIAIALWTTLKVVFVFNFQARAVRKNLFRYIKLYRRVQMGFLYTIWTHLQQHWNDERLVFISSWSQEHLNFKLMMLPLVQ